MNNATMTAPDTFAEDDLHIPAYERPLSEAALPIENQNAWLTERASADDFRPDVELEYSGNGAMDFIHALFECVALYDEGRVPGWVFHEMEQTTERLIDVLAALPDAPIEELEALRVAFREARLFWNRVYARPCMERRTYLKKLFGAEEKIRQKLNALHAAYVKGRIAAQPARTKAKRRRAVRDSVAAKRADDRRRVFAEIARLVRERRMSVCGAIRHLRRIDTWRSRLGKLSDESWRNYYTRRLRQS